MKSKELKVYNLPDDNYLENTIDAKPRVLFLIAFVVGLLLILEDYQIEGIAIISLSLMLLAFMPRVILMEFYHDYLVLYNKADKSVCKLIYYDEVVSWYYTWTANKDCLTIELVDGSIEKVEAFSKTRFEYLMNFYLKDKNIKPTK